MIFEILLTAALAAILFFLWRIVTILDLAVNNQIEQATTILAEVERIRAGLFVATFVEIERREEAKEEGWPYFDRVCDEIVRGYIHPQRLQRLTDA